MSKDMDRDEQAPVLRDEGRSFVGIAGILELDSARAANAAFNRGLRGQPNAEQAWLRSREVARLNALASRLRGRDDLSVEEVVRRLRGLQHERERVLTA